ncbi:MAG: DUF502 domain-containing protein [Deltaproteobacteria bacterium]|nr:DUF502 domain-containing protein [Deltaproteobacteria bacterium]
MIALLKTLIRKYILTGFLVLIPVFLTGWVLITLFRITDKALALIPRAYRPETLIGFNIPGLGMLISFLLVFVLGAFVANVIGRKFLATGEKLLEKIPIVRWFYFSSKQILEAVFAKEGDSFRRVVLIEYPRKGLYSVGFVTGESKGEVDRKVPGPSLTVFIPTTPNPTSGFLYIVPETETIPLSWSVEDAFRMVVSAGVILPTEANQCPGPVRSAEEPLQ